MSDSGPGTLTLEVVLSLQRELYAAFSDDEFQESLAEIEARHGRAYEGHTSEHTELFLTVQDKILPKYGFGRGQIGVLRMLRSVSCFNGNPIFQRNRLELNRLIGLAPEVSEEQPDEEKPHKQFAHQGITRAEIVPPLITEMLEWQPRERRSLKFDSVSNGLGVPPRSSTRVRASACNSSIPEAGDIRTIPATQSSGTAVSVEGDTDVRLWVQSLHGGKLSEYESLLCRLIDNTSQIKRNYPHLQDFFAAVPVESPDHRMLFARAIRDLPEPS